MSPLPEVLVDRWQHRHEPCDSDDGLVYWHVLLGHQEPIRRAVQCAQDRLANFPGLHMTPLKWLHMTVLVAGSVRDITEDDRLEMLAQAKATLSRQPPISVSCHRIFYHPEAIVLEAQAAETLSPIREAAISATNSVTGRRDEAERDASSWSPHVTICYSTLRQAAGPIIASLGKHLTDFEIQIESLSLVVQRGPERLWNWQRIGDAHLSAGTPNREAD